MPSPSISPPPSLPLSPSPSISPSPCLPLSPSPSLLVSRSPPLPAAAPDTAVWEATATASRRWPALAVPLQTAADLVASDALYALPPGLPELALCKPPADWRQGVVRATPTGLACDCGYWPPPTPLGPGDGRYCPHILAYLLALYLQRPLPPLPYAPETLWQMALRELQHETLKAVYDLWLRDTRVIPAASSPTLLTIAARDRRAYEWLSLRLNPVVTRAVHSVAGYAIAIRFVERTKDEGQITKCHPP